MVPVYRPNERFLAYKLYNKETFVHPVQTGGRVTNAISLKKAGRISDYLFHFFAIRTLTGHPSVFFFQISGKKTSSSSTYIFRFTSLSLFSQRHNDRSAEVRSRQREIAPQNRCPGRERRYYSVRNIAVLQKRKRNKHWKENCCYRLRYSGQASKTTGVWETSFPVPLQYKAPLPAPAKKRRSIGKDGGKGRRNIGLKAFERKRGQPIFRLRNKGVRSSEEAFKRGCGYWHGESERIVRSAVTFPSGCTGVIETKRSREDRRVKERKKALYRKAELLAGVRSPIRYSEGNGTDAKKGLRRRRARFARSQ